MFCTTSVLEKCLQPNSCSSIKKVSWISDTFPKPKSCKTLFLTTKAFSFDNRWPRVMIAITVHGSKNIYLLYVMQRTHILVTKSNSGEAGRGGGGWQRQSQLMRRTLTINNFFLIVWCFFPVCTRAARFFQRLRIVRRRSGAAAAARPPPRRVGDIAGGSNHTWIKRGRIFLLKKRLNF